VTKPGQEVGPGTIAAVPGLDARFPSARTDGERRAALDADLADLARRHDVGGGAMEWEYLLHTGRRVTPPATSRP
jgi:hypothetical protein